MVNSVTVWFAAPFLLGRRAAPSRLAAPCAGAVFMAAALMSYFTFGALRGAPPGHDGTVGVADVFADPSWYLIAIAAGIVGGALGWASRHRPVLMLVLALAVAADLFRRGAGSWETSFTAVENGLLLAGGAGSIVVWMRRRASGIAAVRPL
ncbi:hypothetical protein [Tomitella cavernea]